MMCLSCGMTIMLTLVITLYIFLFANFVFNMYRCTSLLAPKIMPLLHRVEHCAIYFGTILSLLPKVTGYNLYWICT